MPKWLSYNLKTCCFRMYLLCELCVAIIMQRQHFLLLYEVTLTVFGMESLKHLADVVYLIT